MAQKCQQNIIFYQPLINLVNLFFMKKYIFFYISEKMLTKIFTLQKQDAVHQLIFQTLE